LFPYPADIFKELISQKSTAPAKQYHTIKIPSYTPLLVTAAGKVPQQAVVAWRLKIATVHAKPNYSPNE